MSGNALVRWAILSTFLAWAEPIGAQGWSAEVQAGRLRHESDVGTPSSTSFVLGLRGGGARAGIQASAGVPTIDTDPTWGAVSVWGRPGKNSGAHTFGADLAAQVFALRLDAAEPGLGGLLPELQTTRSAWGIAGHLMPMFSAHAASLRLEARAGAAHVSRSIDGGAMRSRTLPLADIQIAVTPDPLIGFSLQLNGYAPDEADYAVATAALFLSPHSALTVWGTAGHWIIAPDDNEISPLAAGLLIGVTNRATLLASVRRTGFDPLFQTPSRTAWSLGLRFQLARPRAPLPPVPASYAAGKATLLLPVSHSAEQPRVAGDFNGWNPQPMSRQGENWAYTVAVPPGVYNYAFVRSNGEWFVPESQPGRRDDGMGGHVAVLVVR